MCNWVLRNATRSPYLRAGITCMFLLYSSEGLNLKFDQPSEVTFKYVSGKLPYT